MKKYCVLFLLFFIAPKTFADSIPLGDIFQDIFKNIKRIEEMQDEPCGVCRQKLIKKALDGLDSIFFPGKLFDGENGLLFIKNSAFLDHSLVLFPDPLWLKTKSMESGEIPQQIAITFKFHTEKKHLIGIQRADFTLKKIAEIFTNGKEDDRFKGHIKVISFEYGDRRSLNYYPSMATLEIHCRVLNLKQLD